MTGFTGSLEEKANQITKSMDNNWDNSIPSVLKREIALAANQIDHLRESHKSQNKSFTKAECDIGTELLQMKERAPKYSPYKFPERERFQARLQGVASERRRFKIHYEEKMQNLQKHLLGLIHKYEQIKNINHEPRQSYPKARTFNAKTG